MAHRPSKQTIRDFYNSCKLAHSCERIRVIYSSVLRLDMTKEAIGGITIPGAMGLLKHKGP